MTQPSAASTSPLIVLVEPEDRQHAHTDTLAQAGFRVVSVSADDATVNHILEQTPNLVAAELTPSRAAQTFDFVRRFRQHPDARPIPFIVYGHHLRVEDIEAAARAGSLWLQLEPSDGARLVAASRGLMAAARKEPV